MSELESGSGQSHQSLQGGIYSYLLSVDGSYFLIDIPLYLFDIDPIHLFSTKKLYCNRYYSRYVIKGDSSFHAINAESRAKVLQVNKSLRMIDLSHC